MARTVFTEQKDSNEFLTQYSDVIEKELIDKSRKFLLEDTFEFTKCRQLICQNPACKIVKNRIENYKSLSLGIKDITSIQQAIQKELDGEIIEMKCSGRQEEVKMKKRELFASSPNVLIVHLKRIDVNPKTAREEKLNSFVKFDPELDLRPYSFHDFIKKEGI